MNKEKITHERARNELRTFRGIANYSFNVIDIYISQQEKQDKELKLLELHRELLKESKITPTFKGDELLTQIKELEND